MILKGSQTERPVASRVGQFEYGVILKGSQTTPRAQSSRWQFEYGVILKGSQTACFQKTKEHSFEYGVILKGSQDRALQGVVLSRPNGQDKILLYISNAERLGDVFLYDVFLYIE